MNKENYVTFFDYSYLPQGLSLISSMEKNITEYKLWIITLDIDVNDALKELQLKNVHLIELIDCMDEELEILKKERSNAEFCWTITAHVIKSVFKINKNISRLTYLDADLWFRKAPTPIFNEFLKSGCDAMVTEHGYDTEYNQESLSGRFCVQFMTFKRGGMDILDDWDKCCREWCFDRFENGKFGDQRYLDGWSHKFPNRVHIYSSNYHFQAPWSNQNFKCEDSIIWHFHSLKLIVVKKSYALIDCYGGYILNTEINRKIYSLYLDEIKKALSIMKLRGRVARVQRILTGRTYFIELIKNILRGKITLPRKISKVKI